VQEKIKRENWRSLKRKKSEKCASIVEGKGGASRKIPEYLGVHEKVGGKRPTCRKKREGGKERLG